MAPAYKLTYFNLRARAEPIRWLLSYAGQEFEDNRIDPEKKDQWLALKPSTPLGQLPVLEADGKKLGQSSAIARFLARKHGLVGKDAWEEAQVDALVDFVNDALKGHFAWIQTFLEMDGKEGSERNDIFVRALTLKEEYTTVGVVPFLQTLERKLQDNNEGQGFFIGGQPTWVDIAVVAFEDEVITIDPFILDEKYPLLKAHNQRVHELKGIKEWIAKRPDTSL